ncbi:sll1863 family stress response protein [Spirochaeta dissipatitropha]
MSAREELIQKLKTRLDEWNKSIDELEAQAEKVEADAKIKLQEQLQDLKKQRDSARNDLRDLQSASSEAFEDMKDGLEQAWKSINDSFRSALTRFKD